MPGATRYLAAAIALCACVLVGHAEAKPTTYSVVIQSEPAGATVWIGDRSAEPVGKTPYTARLRAGKHTVFVELEGYVFVAAEIRVRKRKRTQRFSYQLEELKVGYINVLPSGEGADGAKVLLDGNEVGTVPDTFEASEGSHELKILRDGFEPYELLVEVGRGDHIDVDVQLKPLRAQVNTTPGAAAVTSQVPTAASTRKLPRGRRASAALSRPPVVAVGVGAGAGRRKFEYDTPRTGNLRPYLAPLITLIDIDAQLSLSAFGASPWLERISLIGNVTLALPVTSSTVSGDEDIRSSWFRREIGLRGDLGLGPGRVRIELAEGGNAFSFANAGELADELPEVAYEYVRLGVAYALVLGGNALGLGGDGLLAFSAGDLARRFDTAQVIGIRAHGFYMRRLSKHMDAVLASSYTTFRYTFGSSMAMPAYDADGGADIMTDLVLNLAYRF